jgi:hypothetical protein
VHSTSQAETNWIPTLQVQQTKKRELSVKLVFCLPEITLNSNSLKVAPPLFSSKGFVFGKEKMTESSLNFYTIFNPSKMKNKKGEELSDIQEQILFYHASSSGHPLEKQVKNIGLAQTLQSFAHYFDTGVKGESAEAESSLVWKTGKGKSALFRAEGDYWILMVI